MALELVGQRKEKTGRELARERVREEDAEGNKLAFEYTYTYI